MATVPDGKRAGRGFKALRERYVRRAEFLESQQAYWVAVKKAREDWNQKYPEWPIIIKDHPYPEPPESLDRRIFHDARQDIEYTSEHGDYNFDRDYRPLDALAAWQKKWLRS